MSLIPDPLQFCCRLILVLSVTLLPACKVPVDPEGTTDEVTGAVLVVGALGSPLDPVDADAIASIAASMHAEPKITIGDPHTLFAQLQDGQVHIVAGAIPANTPFADDVALSDPMGDVTLPDGSEDRVLAIRKGENRFLVTVNRALVGMEQ